MQVKGDFEKLRRMRAEIKRLPQMQEAVARRAASEITALARATYDARQSVFGDSFGTNKDGSPRTLKKSGALYSKVSFVQAGTKIRCVLGVPYARFQIRNGILPRGGGAMPVKWNAAIKRIAELEFSVRLGRV